MREKNRFHGFAQNRRGESQDVGTDGVGGVFVFAENHGRTGKICDSGRIKKCTCGCRQAEGPHGGG